MNVDQRFDVFQVADGFTYGSLGVGVVADTAHPRSGTLAFEDCLCQPGLDGLEGFVAVCCRSVEPDTVILGALRWLVDGMCGSVEDFHGVAGVVSPRAMFGEEVF